MQTCDMCDNMVEVNTLIKCPGCDAMVCPDCRWQIPKANGELTDHELCDVCSQDNEKIDGLNLN